MMANSVEHARFEEITDFPEKISAQHPAGEDESASLHAKNDAAPAQTGKVEELTDISLDLSEPAEILDDYTGKSDPPGRKMTDQFDISSLAAEIDGITRIERQPKKATPVKVIKEEKGPVPPLVAKQESAPPVPGKEALSRDEQPAPAMNAQPEDSGGVVIYEEDDVDLDYYSIEELEGKMEALQSADSSGGKADDAGSGMPVFDAEVPRAKPAKEATGAGNESKALPRETISKDSHEAASTAEKPGAGSMPEIPVERDRRITLEVPDDLKDRLPEDFDFSDLTAIDLKEAEQIANEDIILLNEDDLIEELEEFDLTPVDTLKAAPPRKKPEKTRAAEVRPGTPEHAPMRAHDESEISSPAESPAEKPSRGKAEAAVPETEKDVPAHSVETVVREIKSAPILRETPEATSEAILEKDDHGKDAEPAASTERPEPRSLPEEQTVPAQFTAIETEPLEMESVREPATVGSEEPLSINEPASSASSEPILPQEIEVRKISGKPADREARPPAQASLKKEPLEIERIPVSLEGVHGERRNIFIIDDPMVERPQTPEESILEVDELDRITSEIASVMEGAVQFLYEASPTEDAQYVAPVMKGQTPAFEDLLADLESEYSFKDDEIELVDSVFIADDYQDYIRDIDATGAGKHDAKLSSAVELLGLDSGEIGTIEGNMFVKEYEGIDLDERLRAMRIGLDQPTSDLKMLKKCAYLLPRPDSLSEEERRSIEEDVSGGSAFIFEEDVEEIRFKLNQVLKKREGDPEEKIPDISADVIVLNDSSDLERFIDTIPAEKKHVLKNLLWYLDKLFDKLPEDVIRKFAESEYFDLYSKVLTDLGK